MKIAELLPKKNVLIHLNPLHAGELFHCYELDECICNFKGVRSIFKLSLLFHF